MRTTDEIEIRATPAEVFEWFVDPRRHMAWLETRSTWLPNDRAELRPGYRGSEQWTAPSLTGRKETHPTEVELTAYDPPRLLEMSGVNRRVKWRARYDLSPTPTGTHLRCRVDTTYREVTARAVMTLWTPVLKLSPGARNAGDPVLQRLREMIEAEIAAG